MQGHQAHSEGTKRASITAAGKDFVDKDFTVTIVVGLLHTIIAYFTGISLHHSPEVAVDKQVAIHIDFVVGRSLDYYTLGYILGYP